MTTDTYGRPIITAPRDTVLTILDGIADALGSDDTARAVDLLEYLRDTIESEV